jgi:hypothetical protein
MSSAFSTDQGQKRMRWTDSVIADRQIFCSGCLVHFRGTKEERCLNTRGVAQGHFRKG